MKYLLEKWQLNSLWQVAFVLLTFTFAGSSVVVLKGWYFEALGFTEQTAFWLKAVAYALFIFPAYQCLLLLYGTLFGQFRFFWEKEKKLFSLVAKPFRS